MQALGYSVRITWNRYRKISESRRQAVKEDPGLGDRIWLQGQEGENGLAGFLAQTLDDRYTWVKGYWNPNGEIDGILVGPDGIFAVEIKHIKGTIYCHDGLFTRDKEDAYGNRVLFGEPITDHGGRSPAAQVNEPADLLERFLQKGMPHCKVCRNVIFTNADADFGALQNPTVDGVFLLSDWNLRDMFRKSTSRLTAREVEVTVRQIERDHRYYYQKRRQAKSAPRPTGPSRSAKWAPAA